MGQIFNEVEKVCNNDQDLATNCRRTDAVSDYLPEQSGKDLPMREEVREYYGKTLAGSTL